MDDPVRRHPTRAEQLDILANLAGHAGGFTGIVGDLEGLAGIDVPAGPFRAIYTALTFHDLPDGGKRAVIFCSTTGCA